MKLFEQYQQILASISRQNQSFKRRMYTRLIYTIRVTVCYTVLPKSVWRVAAFEWFALGLRGEESDVRTRVSTTSISEILYLLLPSRDMTENIIKVT